MYRDEWYGMAEEYRAFDDAKCEIYTDYHNQGDWDKVGILFLHVYEQVVKKNIWITIFVWINKLSQKTKYDQKYIWTQIMIEKTIENRPNMSFKK